MTPKNQLTVLLLAASIGWQGRAAAADEPREIAIDQATLAARFERLESLTLRIAELAEAEDPGRAEQLRSVIQASREMAVADRFDVIVELLRSEQLAAAGRNQLALADQLARLMQLLLADPREARNKAERKRLEALRKEVGRHIKQQQSLRDALYDGESPEKVSKGQGELADRVEQTRRRAGGSKQKPAEAPNKAGEASPPLGEDSPAADRAEPAERVRERLEEARRAMQRAIEQLKQNQAEAGEAGEAEQAEAQRRLEDAQREVDEALRQLREEEQVRMITRLATRFRRMLAEQTKIYELTKQTAAQAAEPVDRSTRLAAGGLAQREDALALLADGALRLLREDGQSLAFPQATEQLRNDMRLVAGWLSDVRLGTGTQRLEEDLIEQLGAGIAAFEQAAAEKREQQQQQQQGQEQAGQPSDPQLVDLLAELRMIRSLQTRVLRRTSFWDEMVASGESPAAEARAALRKIADDQNRLSAAADELGRKMADR